MVRIIAALMLLIPGIISAYGIKLMRDSLFSEFYPIFVHIGIQFVVGLLLFLGGIAFVGGFIVHRDRRKHEHEKKRNKSK